MTVSDPAPVVSIPALKLVNVPDLPMELVLPEITQLLTVRLAPDRMAVLELAMVNPEMLTWDAAVLSTIAMFPGPPINGQQACARALDGCRLAEHYWALGRVQRDSAGHRKIDRAAGAAAICLPDRIAKVAGCVCVVQAGHGVSLPQRRGNAHASRGRR